uniref:Membrane-associated protein n=1 Tax=Noctiluca scintillans TaxID=2966 RepID=A0A7S0ZNR6_NOCSC
MDVALVSFVSLCLVGIVDTRLPSRRTESDVDFDSTGSEPSVAYNYLLAQTSGDCTATGTSFDVNIHFTGFDTSNTSTEFCLPLDTLTMTLANLLSTQKACVTDPILRRLEASSEPEGRRLQSLVVTGTEAEFNSHVVTDACPDIDSCIGSVALGAFGSDSTSSAPNAFEIYLRSLNNMYATVTTSVDIITTTTTTTTSLATTTEDGGGLPWWAWFFLLLGVCCLICCVGILVPKVLLTEDRRPLTNSPRMATATIPMATATIPMATATIPMATATITTAPMGARGASPRGRMF